MIDLDKELPSENLTQRDIMQFLLHSTQHVATREELESVRQELKENISKLDDKISKIEARFDDMATKEDVSRLDDRISKVEAKFDKIQWLIIATMFTVLFKDYILSFIQIAPATP